MGRGISSGGGQSSLGYLFGGPEQPQPAKPAPAPARPAPVEEKVVISHAPVHQSIAESQPANPNTSTNNYQRAAGQNTGNFVTERRSTRVHSEPGGGSSLGYLFGGPK